MVEVGEIGKMNFSKSQNIPFQHFYKINTSLKFKLSFSNVPQFCLLDQELFLTLSSLKKTEDFYFEYPLT